MIFTKNAKAGFAPTRGSGAVFEAQKKDEKVLAIPKRFGIVGAESETRTSSLKERKNMKLTNAQKEALVTIATSTRVNFADIGGRTCTPLIKAGLVKKDWHKNDASGERVVLTEAGSAVVKGLL